MQPPTGSDSAGHSLLLVHDGLVLIANQTWDVRENVDTL
jgi:hypothetical protein